MSLRVTHCVPTDGSTIGSIETSTVSKFLRLQLGTATSESMKNWLADQYSNVISYSRIVENDIKYVYLKVVEQNANGTEEGEMISFAPWELPDDGNAPKTSGGIKGLLTPGMNRAFIDEASFLMEDMYDRVLNGRKCFYLHHLSTFPNHQRRGAASLLVTWPFDRADREGIVCYLNSQTDGEGVKLYERVDFKKVNECHVGLTMCGLTGVYKHVVMVREPKKTATEGETIG